MVLYEFRWLINICFFFFFLLLFLFFFFFQAEDGIRDHCVTGVQTCALPILELWKDRFSDKVVNIYTDNKALVPVIEKLYCKDPEIRRILRPIALSCMQNNILLIPVHIKGDENTRADLLSRNRIMHFREMYPSMSRYPTQLPEVLNPIAIRAQLW